MRLVTILLLLCSTLSHADDILLFNGKNLDGWIGDAKFWTVEDGYITAESTAANPCKRTNYLRYTKKEVNNFELTVAFRFLSEKGNSGIQYRSRYDAKKDEMVGYQADMEVGPNYSGILYDQGGRGIVAKRGQRVTLSSKGKKSIKPLPSGKKAQDSIKHGQWNTYKIIANGNTLTHMINGHETVVVIDNDPKHADSKGYIALQIHSGPAMKVQFKDINLLELDHQEPLRPAHWIWDKTTSSNQSLVFEKTFEVKNPKKLPQLAFSCDNQATVYLNDKKIASSNDWQKPKSLNISKFAHKGTNKLRIEATNTDGPAGLLVQLGSVLMSDQSWSVRSKTSKDKQAATIIATHGDAPWGKVLEAARPEVSNIKTLDGFQVEKIYSVPKSQGSWVSLAFDPNGNAYCCDQYGALYRLSIENGSVTKLEKVNAPGKAQGLCWAYGSLYMSVATKTGGVFRLTDTNNNGVFDKQEQILHLDAGSEHGSHSIIPAKGGGLYLVAGNFTSLPKGAKSLHNNNWKEDHLLKRLVDPRGHANHVKAPGGYIVHIGQNGENPHIVSTGFRNPYGLAQSPQGELFTYDADMEWDAGTPWYRPTRVLHATEGAEFGWRTGTSKWPEYFADSLPSVLDIGPGSPTGTIFGTGAKFPQKYKDALYILDWTFGRIYALHLTPSGSTYKATKETFISGKPLPVSAATIAPDGSMYFVTGGRRLHSALYRVTYTGSVEPVPSSLESPPLKKQLDTLVQSPTLKNTWQNLASEDRRMRFTARFALERLPLDSWLSLYKKEKDPLRVIYASIALARLEKQGETILGKLSEINYASLSKPQKLEFLRALSLCFIRTKVAPSLPEAKKLANSINSSFPTTDFDLNVESGRVLTHLDSQGIIQKLILLMESSVNEAQDIDQNLLKDNQKYGKDFERMLRNQPNAKAIQFALILMSANPAKWNTISVTRYYTWLNQAEQKDGGQSYKGFISNIRKEALKSLPKDLQAVAKKAPKPNAKTVKLPIPKGPGINWTVATAVAATKDLSTANMANGKRMFQATLCAKCHVHGTQGGVSGPNLTHLSMRFSKEDMLKAIINPSEEISEQYHFQEIEMLDGSTVTGKILSKTDKLLTVAPSAFTFEATLEVDRSKVKSIRPSKISPMPPALINSLNAEELRDLMKFLTTAQ